ncbi:hypothetical protein [Phormidium tenue]|uniref:Uncharacterized protein n=1 Tax=Phormidium tenue NIES-30 TaxID=549789 RepID=A0A1U7IZA2_9CYAN|nr:hypothetical protein [Phormidium tenue]MBD2234614.1 hypothetical protein [Phormidium tenue FACHB-1052]OKH44198.1 hypothetical protein NIES30_23145 [Phormidium tenue NIES-30]
MIEVTTMQLKAIAFPNLQQLAEGFTGRSHIFTNTNHWLQQKDQRFFILTGEPGVGKSAIAILSNPKGYFSITPGNGRL